MQVVNGGDASRGLPGDPFGCSGKVALVTGASAGLGAQIAKILDALGARVAVAARRAERLNQLAEHMADGLAFPADLSTPSANAALVEAVIQRFGRINIVVANAAISNVTPALKESHKEFSRQLQTNIAGPFALFTRAAAEMKAAGTGGSLMAISSVFAHRIQSSVPSAGYTASKSAVRGLTGELAVQWARYGIRVNAIAPGVFPSEMTADGIASPDWMTKTTQRIPLGRIGELGDLFGPVALLASDAGRYITGQSLVVDGGWSL